MYLRQYYPSTLAIGYTAGMDTSIDKTHQTLEQPSSESLMLAYASGDVEAFNELYELHKGPLFRFLLRQGVSSTRADEMFQEIWLKVINARDNYQSSARFQTWLYTIARNHSIDEFRRESNQQVIAIEDQEIALEDSSGPEDIVEKDRQKKHLLKSVSLLPFEQRQYL